MAPSLYRSAARSSVTSHLGTHAGDRSYLLVRERPGRTHTSECLTLHGVFDGSLHESLHRILLGLTHSTLPLVLDLRGIGGLDEGFLARLLKAHREVSSTRAVSFQVAADGPVLPLIQRLGLEERFGLEPPVRLPRLSTPVVPQAGQTTIPTITQTRRTQWATNENH